MKPRVRNILLEPKRFFGDLWHVISWPKVIALLIVVVFFVNLGMFIYDKKNPTELDSLAVNKVQSPYTEETHEDMSPTGLFGQPQMEGKGDDNNAPIDASGVFEKMKSKDGENLPPIAKIKVLTSSQQEAIYAGDTIFLSGSESYDPDGMIKTYRWDYDQSNGLGIDGEGVNTTVKFHNPGVYTITLMAIDDFGAETTTTMSLNVSSQKEEQSNGVVQGLTTNHIDIDSLNFMSRMEVQNALETSYADFTSESYTMLAQTIYNSQKKDLPTLPSLADIELAVGKDPTNTPPVVDSFIPREGSKIFEQRPVISVGFYGNNKVDVDGIELTVDGKPVTSKTMKTEFGVQYKPDADLGFGQHSVMIVVPDERGLETVQSYSFEVIDRKAENADLIKEYEDLQGPQILVHNPDKNAKNVKPSTEILIKYDEPVNPDTVEIAVVDLSTNISKFFTKSQIVFDSTNTTVTISPNENIFDYDRSYQILARQSDELENTSSFDWYVMGEEYGAPEFKITGPENNSATNDPQVTVTGFTDPSNQITVGNTPAVVDLNGAWKADISLVKGKNEILIVSKDLKGRESSQYLVLTYDAKAAGGNPILDSQVNPVIMDASIRDGQTINKLRPQISFVFADTDGIDRESIVLKVNDEDVTNLAFIAEDSITYKPLEPFKQGEQKVQIIVADKKGNTTDYSMTFMVDAYPENPTALTAALTNNNENVLLVWDGVTNVSNPNYRVFRSTQPNVKTTAANEIARDLTSTSFTDTDVVNGAKYYYVVTAVNADENLSKPSNEVTIRVDFAPPALGILYPEKNFVTEQDYVVVEGVTEVGSVVDIYVNFQKVGTPVLDTNGEFALEVDLIPGENIITTIATDSDGNESIDVRTVTYNVPDVDAPRPENNRAKSPMGTDVAIESNISVTYNEKINPETISLVLKRVDNTENVIPVTITDIALQVSADGKTLTYNPRVDLDHEARYSVDITVEDMAGNESVNDDWEFETVDKDAPLLEVISPKADFFADQTDIFVSGKTEPYINLTIRVTTASGNNAPVTPYEYKLTSQSDGTFKQLVELFPYKENIITVIATDKLGHSSMQVVEGVASPPDTERPLLLVQSPVSNSTVGTSTVTVTGQSEPEVRITINVNGEVQQDFDMDGNTNFNKKIRLNGGQNLVKIIATDKTGNQEQVNLTVFYDNIKPLLDVANPIDGLTTNQGKVELRGMTEAEGVTVTVTVNSDAPQTLSVLPDGTFKTNLTFKVGNNTVVVRGTDAMGNVTTIMRSVYHDPVKGIESPGSNGGVSGAGAGEGDVSGSGDTGTGGTGSGTNTGSTTGSGEVDGQSTNDAIDNSTGDQKFTGGDNSAPDKLEINPSHGTETNQPGQSLDGKTEAEADVTVYQNGKKVYDGKADVNTGSFSGEVELQEGKNIFISNSQDASGNRTSEVDAVTLDTKGPNTMILAPKANTLTNENEIIVYGLTEAETKVVIRLDGRSKTLTSDEYGYFTVPMLTGADGVKEIVVEASDRLGNTTTKKVSITVDKTKTSSTLISINGVNLSSAVASSPNGGLVTIEGTTATLIGRTEAYASVELLSNHSIVGTVKADERGDFRVSAGFASGEISNVRVNVTDKAGNVESKYFRVRADKEPPVITLYRPNTTVNASGYNTSISGGNVRVSGIVEDDSNPVTIVFGLNESPNVGSTTTSGSFDRTIGPLKEGTNIIHLTATDAAGNKVHQTTTVVYRDGGITWLGDVNRSVAPDNTYFKFGANLSMAAAAAGGKGDYGIYPSIPNADFGYLPPQFQDMTIDYIGQQALIGAIAGLMESNKDLAQATPHGQSPAEGAWSSIGDNIAGTISQLFALAGIPNPFN